MPTRGGMPGPSTGRSGQSWQSGTVRSPVSGRLYFAYLIVLCVVFTVPLLLSAVQIRDVAASYTTSFWVLCVLAVVAGTPIFTVPRPGQPETVSASVFFTFTISYTWGHGTGRLAQTVAILVASLFTRRDPWLVAFDVGRYGLALWASGVVARLGGPALPVQQETDHLGYLLIAGAVWYAVFRVLTATEAWLRGGGSWLRTLHTGIGAEALSAGALLLLSPILLADIDTEVWAIPLVLVPLFAVSTMIKLWNDQSERYLRDPLTGLPNRTAMAQQTERATGRAAANRAPDAGRADGLVALLVVDLDQFQLINDALGYGVADRVLVAVGDRLTSQAGPDTAVARLKGDQFGLLVSGLPSEEEALARASAVRAQFDEPIMINGQPLNVDASIGIAMYPRHGTDFDTMVRHADTAMRQAKDLPGGVAMSKPDAESTGMQRLTLLGELRRVLDRPDNTEIVPYYQPQIELGTGEIVGVEALLRWRHPTRGMVSPEEIVRVAERSPVMQQITRTMIERTLRQVSRWRAGGFTVRASVNVSVRDLYTNDLALWLRQQLRRYDVPPDSLQLEITESALMTQPGSVLSSLQLLRDLGIGAALDDFGTGFSSLQHLRGLPITEIKIDRSFTQSMVDDAGAEAIVRSMINLAKDLGIRVVAEGVDDERTRMRLLADGCHIAQGWYYAKAMPVDEFDRWLAEHRAPGRRPATAR